ncbi:MAG: bifunctional pyr operon transcriptional regulator/uracil phosphoribosyltransferase [Elusimicrobia bacterium RIFCSPLOWO2_01_FULL_60_11]|nr:MAG: bifunctional pyr operon transcriptional regulator/uracil phosphoribosyltransferase [Elusimicrobia bacterium RIFCSPLOWO2_01_FULL_60_11]
MKQVLSPKEFKTVLEKIAGDFYMENESVCRHGADRLGIVGIQTRGVHVAGRIAEILKKKHKSAASVGSLDITLYRDDVSEIGSQPLVKETDIPFPVEGKTILLVDDVLYTGRTIRAALDALLELGRPRKVLLACVVDREGRELPIRADYLGLNMKVKAGEKIQLKVKEVDGKDGIWIVQ